MNHLWIAYDALLVTIGIVNLLLLFLVRGRKPFLGPLLGFYAAFTLGLFVAMSRRYVVFNIDGAPSTIAFWSYGLNTWLSYFALAWVVPLYERLLERTESRRTVAFVAAMSVAGLVAISPWSVQVSPDADSYLLKPGHYVAGLAYFGVFSYIMYLAFVAVIRHSDSSDRFFVRVLFVFAAVGYIESSSSLFAEFGQSAEQLGAEGEYFLFSSIPYALFSAYLTTYLLGLIGAAPTPVQSDAAKMDGLGLSEREREVLELLLKGMSNKAIANELHISEATVKTHLNKIFRKANVRSRFELARQLSA